MIRHPDIRFAASIAARSARVAGVLLVTAAMVTVASFAQTVPVPKPAPKGRDNTPPSGGPSITGATQAPPNPVIPDPRRNVPSSIFQTFDANQKAQAAKVSNYLSSLQTVSGNFVQVGPDGSKTQGDFYIQKPGKMRVEYDPPSPIDIVADGSSVVVRDRKLATQDLYPLSQTPLRFLLADRIDLMRDTNVIGVYVDDIFATVVIEERQILGGTHKVMLMFGAQDYQLRQWTVTDPQGYDTTVAVYNLDNSKTPDPNMFRIDYTRQIQ